MDLIITFILLVLLVSACLVLFLIVSRTRPTDEVVKTVQELDTKNAITHRGIKDVHASLASDMANMNASLKQQTKSTTELRSRVFATHKETNNMKMQVLEIDKELKRLNATLDDIDEMSMKVYKDQLEHLRKKQGELKVIIESRPSEKQFENLKAMVASQKIAIEDLERQLMTEIQTIKNKARTLKNHGDDAITRLNDRKRSLTSSLSKASAMSSSLNQALKVYLDQGGGADDMCEKGLDEVFPETEKDKEYVRNLQNGIDIGASSKFVIKRNQLCVGDVSSNSCLDISNFKQIADFCNQPPVNCEVSEWGPWDECSKPCGKGTQTRKRTVLKAAQNGGTACPVLVETQDCNTQACSERVDCEVSPWSDWTPCNKECGTGTQTRKRDIIKKPQNGGTACPAQLELEETKSCNTQDCVKPVDCEVGSWSEWGACDKPCGTGQQTRSREVVKQQADGGKTCPTLTESQACNTQECAPLEIDVDENELPYFEGVGSFSERYVFYKKDANKNTYVIALFKTSTSGITLLNFDKSKAMNLVPDAGNNVSNLCVIKYDKYGRVLGSCVPVAHPDPVLWRVFFSPNGNLTIIGKGTLNKDIRFAKNLDGKENKSIQFQNIQKTDTNNIYVIKYGTSGQIIAASYSLVNDVSIVDAFIDNNDSLLLYGNNTSTIPLVYNLDGTMYMNNKIKTHNNNSNSGVSQLYWFVVYNQQKCVYAGPFEFVERGSTIRNAGVTTDNIIVFCVSYFYVGQTMYSNMPWWFNGSGVATLNQNTMALTYNWDASACNSLRLVPRPQPLVRILSKP